jgi:hypothetical protein
MPGSPAPGDDCRPGEAVRSAVREDNLRLIDLERSCPQGSHLLIASERRDYFFRSFLYGNDHTWQRWNASWIG